MRVTVVCPGCGKLFALDDDYDADELGLDPEESDA